MVFRIIYYLIIVSSTVAYGVYLLTAYKARQNRKKRNIITCIYVSIIFSTVYISNINLVEVKGTSILRSEINNNYEIEFTIENKTFIPVHFTGVIWTNVEGEDCIQITAATVDEQRFYEGFRLRGGESKNVKLSMYTEGIKECNFKYIVVEYNGIRKLNYLNINVGDKGRVLLTPR